MAIYVKGYINEKGEIKADLPENHPVGEVTITISEPLKEIMPSDSQSWTEAEIRELLTQNPSTLGEILTAGLVGIGADVMRDLPDSVELVEQWRREKRERRNQWTR